ncbi:SpoIIE family protein phosphatase [Silvanigrella sp.]|uniref:SpoIIE family protein phosphatase n=1 Tax=Silvanigrella sp. TaxID=2024976 RepID=UPI0037CBEDCD
MSFITIEDIIKKWTLKLTEMLKNLYRFVGFIIFIGILGNYLVPNLTFNILVIIVIIICGLFSYLMTQKVQLLMREWHKEFTNPTEKLLQTIQMVSMQKLDLLPEEQLNSFTSESHLKLLEVARGILEHQRFIDQVVDNMFEMMFLLNQDGIIMKANKSACETTHFSQSDLIGQHIRKLFPHAESLVDYYLELEIQFTTQGFVRDVEVFVQTSEGELLPFSINGVKIESTTGVLLGYTMIAKNQAETVRLFNQVNKSNYELGRANEELAKRYDQIKKEIEEKEGQRRTLEMELATSQLVQKTFLPQVAPEHPNVDCAGTAIPAAFCGGDWWNTVTLKDKFFVFIADVTGHGTASAMVTAAVSGYFVSVKSKLFAGENLDVDDILSGFDTVLSSMGHSDVSYNMTCFSCVFDFEKKVIRFANAGHNFPLLIRDDKKVETLIASGNRLGNIGATRIDNKVFEKKEIPMAGGEFIFFYTDGLIENKNDKDEEYGKRRLRKFIEKNYTKASSEFISLLLQDSLEFYGAGKALEDDITVVVTKIKQP